MARAIDADELEKKFGYGPNDTEEERAFNQAARKIIREMLTLTPPTEWVSVEERLPGMSGNYICAVKDKNGSVWTIPAEWSLEMKMWIGAFGEIKNIVTHWMPLPAPPAKEGDR